MAGVSIQNKELAWKKVCWPERVAKTLNGIAAKSGRAWPHVSVHCPTRPIASVNLLKRHILADSGTNRMSQ
jgi:hypothetical protein